MARQDQKNRQQQQQQQRCIVAPRRKRSTSTTSSFSVMKLSCCVLLILSLSLKKDSFVTVEGFVVSPSSIITRTNFHPFGGISDASSLREQQQQQHQMSSSNSEEEKDVIPLEMPLTYDEMLKMVSGVVSEAYFQQNKNRQIIRLLLPRDPNSGNLGQYYESDAADSTLDARQSSQLILVPPDETWQGGIMQLYRAAMPMCRDLLRRLSSNKGGLPPKITEDRSIDESGVDGISLLVAQSSQSPEEDACCFVQPSQESMGYIESLTNQAGKRLTLLVNPQWRQANDAFDEASSKEGFFGGLAARLGGKGATLSKLDELGYEPTFSLEGYVCKGGNIRLLKFFDRDWHVFMENDAMTNYILVGTSSSRPTYQDIDQMLDQKGISVKYARDIGIAPKV